MEPKDIIGKEFTCFKFEPPDKLVAFGHNYKTFIGNSAIVTEIHHMHPQYANAKIMLENGDTCRLHYPTQMIIDQLDIQEKSIEDLLDEVKHLTTQLWKTKI